MERDRSVLTGHHFVSAERVGKTVVGVIRGRAGAAASRDALTDSAATLQ